MTTVGGSYSLTVAMGVSVWGFVGVLSCSWGGRMVLFLLLLLLLLLLLFLYHMYFFLLSECILTTVILTIDSCNCFSYCYF